MEYIGVFLAAFVGGVLGSLILNGGFAWIFLVWLEKD